MAHLMIAAPMLVVGVPFGKWSHLLYRPLALYVLALQRRGAHAVASWRSSPAAANG